MTLASCESGTSSIVTTAVGWLGLVPIVVTGLTKTCEETDVTWMSGSDLTVASAALRASVSTSTSLASGPTVDTVGSAGGVTTLRTESGALLVAPCMCSAIDMDARYPVAGTTKVFPPVSTTGTTGRHEGTTAEGDVELSGWSILSLAASLTPSATAVDVSPLTPPVAAGARWMS